MLPKSSNWYRRGNNRALPPSGDPDAQVEAAHYDAAGNLKQFGAMSLEYDRENRLKKATGSGVTEYGYDGLGRRVVKEESGGAATYYIYDAFGQLAAEYLSSGTGSTVGTHYVSTDHLGSTRVVTNGSGGIVSRHDYLPFGEEIASTVGSRQSVAGYTWNPSLTHRFTGKERDAETGLDYFGARYLSAGMGRFTGADPKPFHSGHIANPQKWNQYAYVLSNPFVYVDPDGREEKYQGAVSRFLTSAGNIVRVRSAAGVGSKGMFKMPYVKTEAGVSALANVKVAPLRMSVLSISGTADAGAKVSGEGFSADGQLKGEMSIMKDGKWGLKFEDQSTLGFTLGIPEVGAKTSTFSSETTLFGLGRSVQIGRVPAVFEAELLIDQDSIADAIIEFPQAVVEMEKSIDFVIERVKSALWSNVPQPGKEEETP